MYLTYHFIYDGKIELAESKKRVKFGGGQVKGNEVERGRMKRGKLKLMVRFPLGMVSLFSVTPSTPCRLEGPGVSAFGCPLVQVCAVTHALTGLCVQVRSCPQILIKWLFMFLQHLSLHLSGWSCFAFLLCLLSFYVWFMSVQSVSSSSTV